MAGKLESIRNDIPSLLESQHFITTRWLACQYEITMDEASDILYNYDKKNDSTLKKSYILSGFDDENVYKFVHVEENEIEQTKSSFRKQPLQSIYSLQCVPSIIMETDEKSSNSVPTQLTSLDMEQAKSFLSNSEAGGHFLLNKVGGITSSSITVKPIGIRNRIHMSSASSVGNGNNANSTSSHLFPKPTINSTASTNTEIKAPSVMVSNFFNKPTTTAASKEKDAKTTSIDTKVSSSKNNDKRVKDNEINIATTKTNNTKDEENENTIKMVINDDDDEKWEDEVLVDKKLLKKIEQKQFEKNVENTEYGRVSKRLNDQDDGNTNNNNDNINQLMDTDPLSNSQSQQDGIASSQEDGPKKSKKNILQRGAMDDYLEDIAIEKEKERLASEAQCLEGGGGSSQNMGDDSTHGKKKIKKLVEKMFADDQGYLVTQMVWEEVEVDEAEAAASEAAEKKNVVQSSTGNHGTSQPLPQTNSKPPSSGSTGGKKNSTSTATQQKSMMSFFTKK